MVDPAGWSVKKGSGAWAFVDPSTAGNGVNVEPIAFNSSDERVAGDGSVSLEHDGGQAVIIDEGSESDQPNVIRLDFCAKRGGANSIGVVFAYQDTDNYYFLESATSSRSVKLGEVSNGSPNIIGFGSAASPDTKWDFVRVEGYPVGANDYRVRVGYAQLPDFKQSGENALDEEINKRLSGVQGEMAGAVGVGGAHANTDDSGALMYIDGIELYWA